MAPELARIQLAIHEKWQAVSCRTTTSAAIVTTETEEARTFQRMHERIEYSMMVDVYAYGTTLFEIAHHRPPWEDVDNPTEVFQRVADGSRPIEGIESLLPGEVADGALDVDISEAFSQCMKQCWEQEATDRPTFGTVLEQMQNLSVRFQEEENAQSNWRNRYARSSSMSSMSSSRPPRLTRSTITPGMMPLLGDQDDYVAPKPSVDRFAVSSGAILIAHSAGCPAEDHNSTGFSNDGLSFS